MLTRTRRGTSLAGAVARTATAKWGSQVLTWAATLVVARHLTPHDYGVVALAGVCLGALTILNDCGLGLAVLAHRELTERQLAQVDAIAVLVGGIAVVLACAAAMLAAPLLGTPELGEVIVALSIVLFMTALRTVAIGRLQKDLRFARLALAEAVQALSTSLVTVTMALSGSGYWALVAGQVVGHTLYTGLVLAWVPPRFARPTRAGLREVLTFSRHIVVGRLAWYVQTRAYVAIVGTWLGGSALGVYSMAESLGRLPVEKIAALVSQVVPAFLAATRDDREGLRHLVLALTEVLAFSVFPIAGGMFLIAPSAVALLLGERWLEVAAPLQAFAIVAASDAVGSVFFPVLVVTGGARLSMYIGLAGSILFPAVFYLGSAGGIVGVTTAYAVVAPLLRVPAYLGVASRTGLTIGRYARALWPALSATAAMAIAIVAIRQWVPSSWPLASGLIVDVLVGASTYGLVLGTAHRRSVARVYRMLRSVRAAPPRVATAIAPLPPIAA